MLSISSSGFGNDKDECSDRFGKLGKPFEDTKQLMPICGVVVRPQVNL